MIVFKGLKLLVKKNIQLVSVLTLITAGLFFTLLATYLYYWLRSPITLIAIWLGGLTYIYIDSFLIGFNKWKYKIDSGKYSELVKNFMERSNLTMYRLYIRKRKLPNASARSFGPMRSITLNTSLCEILPPEQLEAVLAHEVGHHAHNDILVGTIFGATVLDALAFLDVFIDKSLRDGVVILTVSSFILAIGALLIGAFYSRRREANADKFAARLTGRPLNLAKALETIQRNYVEVQGWTLKEEPPLWFRLFSTHTPINERVKILKYESR